MIFDRFRSRANTSVAPSRQRRRTAGRPTTIASEVIIEGHLVTNGEIQIDGTINGDVRARVCIVDANGRITTSNGTRMNLITTWRDLAWPLTGRRHRSPSGRPAGARALTLEVPAPA